MTTGTLRFGDEEEPAVALNRNYGRIRRVLPSGYTPKRHSPYGCKRCSRLALCKDGPLQCEGDIEVEFDSGDMVRM